MMYFYDVLLRAAGGPKTVLTYQSPRKLQPGHVVYAPLNRRHVMGLIVAAAKAPKFKTKTVTPAADETLPLPSQKLLAWMTSFYGIDPASALKQFVPARFPKRPRDPKPANIQPRGLGGLELNSQQQAALSAISRGSASTYLLHGETASGKTLVYRELAMRALSEGKSVVILVPEIALTPQVAADFSDLSEQVFVSHSELNEQERQRIWLYSLQQEQPFIAIGPRSTLFYPFRKLGLIVVDEAHQPTYKQEQQPRYQAQTVAAKLAELHQTKLVLGTATPRVTDYWLAKNRKVPILNLNKHTSSKPQVNLVDLRQKNRQDNGRLLSPDLQRSLSRTLQAKGQALLYLNRRGTAAMAICSQCGWVPTCGNCQLPLSLHHDDDRLVCRQCGRPSPVPVNCPVCGNHELIYRVAGAKAVEREVKRLFPQARVQRFDSDSPAAESFSRLYEQVKQREIDILIGTQSLAHGLDLPNLDLVGVISADSELFLPDFTASERTFDLLFQVIGRAGRQGGGQVIIQSHNPVHPAIVFATEQNYQAYYDYEIELRQRHGYPPFVYLLALVVRSKDPDSGLKTAEKMARSVTAKFGLKTILGPAPAFYFKKGAYYRYLLVLKSKSRPRLVEIAKSLAGSPNWTADLDPINLLF